MKTANSVIHMLAIILLAGSARAQEFPIAVGSDNTFGGGAAFDGTNFLFAILGDASNRYAITAQRFSTTGVLVGSRFPLGQTGSSPMVAFDGTHFLVAWTDSFPFFGSGDTNGTGNIYGQFIHPSGTLVGSRFTMVSDVNIKWGKGRGGIVFNDTAYFLTYHKGGDHHTNLLYGQRWDRSGNPIGGAIQISESASREHALAFDGTNYLVAWVRVDHPNVDKDLFGQFVSTSGGLVGGNFLIDGSDPASDNPVTMTFDGTKFWVAYHELAEDTTGRWNIFARFVSTSGVVADRFMICDSSKSPTFASAGFDGTNYLISWMEFGQTMRIRARVFSSSGVPLDTAFTLFDAIGEKFPIGGIGGFVDGKFLAATTRIDFEMSDGDVYGMFLPATTTGVNDNVGGTRPAGFTLCQNWPNPFNPETKIRFSVPVSGFTSLKVFDVLGRDVATLVKGELEAGSREVGFDASGLPSGVYVYRLQAGPFVQARKMLLVK